MSRKKTSVAHNIQEEEYIATSLASCEAIWLWKLPARLLDRVQDPTMIYCDNQSGVKFSESPVFHDRSKHIDIKYHHI